MLICNHNAYFIHSQIAKPLDEEMKKHNPTRVTVSGHSLGGAVGNLLAYHIATAYPNIMVDMVSYGAPNVGDVDFVASFNQKVNNRHLTFTVSLKLNQVLLRSFLPSLTLYLSVPHQITGCR